MGIPIFGEDITLIGEEPKKRAEKCLDQIQKILKRYDCVIIPIISFVGTKVITGIDIQAKPRKIPGRTDN